MKPWQVVILIYITTAVVAAHLAVIGSSPFVDGLVALGITLLGLVLIRRLKQRQNPNK